MSLKNRKLKKLMKKFRRSIYTNWKPLTLLFCWSSLVTISLSCLPLLYRPCPNNAKFCQWLPLSEIISITTASYLLWSCFHVIFGTCVEKQEKDYEDLLTFSNLFHTVVFFSTWITMLPELLYLNKFLSEILFPVHTAQDLQTSYCEGIKILMRGKSNSRSYRPCTPGGKSLWHKLSLTAKFSFSHYVSCHDRRFFMYAALTFFQFCNCLHWAFSDFSIPESQPMRRYPTTCLENTPPPYMSPPLCDEIDSSAPPPYESIFPEGPSVTINTRPEY